MGVTVMIEDEDMVKVGDAEEEGEQGSFWQDNNGQLADGPYWRLELGLSALTVSPRVVYVITKPCKLQWSIIMNPDAKCLRKVHLVHQKVYAESLAKV